MPRKKKGPILTGLILPLAVMTGATLAARELSGSDVVAFVVLFGLLILWAWWDGSLRFK